MTLSPGARIGPYQIVAPLGAGGMGEVYRARDTKLDRDVALKILPESFAGDPDRLMRFEREAKTLAALNHPNIAAIYGIEDRATGSGQVAIVMELVDGSDLSQVIVGSPAGPGIGVADALLLAKQIADALEAAHELGIVHRDLKPANIKVRPDGTVKVVDFGLAKALDPAGGSGASAANSPTLTNRATEAGIILGTAAYMSPEQAKGRTVDKRADIWAFGVVLHEMLTGRRMFDGESVAETLGLIFAREPDLAALPPDTPASIRALIARCLVKDPRQRLRDIGDARLVLDDAIAGHGDALSGSGQMISVAAAPTRPAWQLPVIIGLVAAIAAAVGWFAKPASPASPAPMTRLAIALPPGERVTTAPAISPDGHLVAYAAGRTPGSSQLYIRALDDFVPRPVAASAGAQHPFFSQDGRTIVFFAGGKMRKASVAGGGAIDIAGAPAPWGGTFDADGRIVFSSGLGSGLWRVSADGGTPEQLTKPDGADAGYAHVHAQRLPGTRDLLFAFWGQTFYSAVLSADTRKWRHATPPSRVLAGVAIFSPSGHLIGNDGAGGIVAAPWTPASTTPVSLDAPVIGRVHWGLSTELSWINVSDNGTAVYVPGNPNDRHLVWVDRQGQTTRLPGEADQIAQMAISRDGRRVIHGGLKAQWILDLATGAQTRLVSDARTWNAGWLPGDDRIVLSSNKDGDWDLYTIAASEGELTPLLKKPAAQHLQAVAKNGTIIYLERQPATGSDLWTLTPDGRTAPLIVTRFNETAASVSEDGRYLAYVSDESGRNDVYAIPASGKGDRTMVSITGGSGPIWSRDGTELFYRAGDDLMSVKVRTTDALTLGERRKLLDLSDYDSGSFHEFEVAPDGKRFLLIRTEPASRPTRLDIIVNWFDELRKKAGGR